MEDKASTFIDISLEGQNILKDTKRKKKEKKRNTVVSIYYNQIMNKLTISI